MHKSKALYKKYFALPGARIGGCYEEIPSPDPLEIAVAITIAVPAVATPETAQLPIAVAKENDEDTGKNGREQVRQRTEKERNHKREQPNRL
ncbi:MAG: hypothetical protein J6K89_04485 [Oscillospiraceae bacterium]|nr:hypothetical protein [Oscillospiraceae bacterium]